MNFNIYNEDRFKQRLRDKYGVKGDVREYLKQNYDSVVSSYQNLMTSYGEYQKLTATMAEVKSKIDNIKEAQKLMPYEILMENGDFKSYLTADYSYYNLLNQDQLAVLSQQEVALYDYLYRTRSKAEADAYLKAMENTMNQRIGAYKAAEYIEYIKDSGYGFNDLLASGWEGTKDGVRNFFDGIADCFRVASTEAGTKSALDYEMMYKTQFMQQLMSDPSYINQDEVNGFLGAVNLNTWYNTGTSIGNMVVPSLVSFVPGGHLLSITLMTMSITGNTAVEAKQEGYSTSQAYLYGAVSGLSETATEVILGGIPGISNLEGKGFVAGMLSEGFEEFTQEYLDVGVRWAILGEKPEFTLASMHDTFSRASQAGIQGAMTSGIMQGGNAGLGVVANSTTRALSPTVTHADGSVSKAYNSFGEFKNTMESNFYTPKAETAISDAIAKVGNGENISFADKIKLNRAISNVSAQELSGITKNLTTDQKASLKSATSGIVKMSSDTSAKLDTADTFAQVESATDSLSNVNNLSKDALNSEVTRDGRTLAEYIADTKTETLDNNTMEMIKSEDPKIAKEMTKRIEKRQKAQFKAFKKQFMEQKQEDATRTPVKTAVQQDSQNASAPATSQQGATDVQVKTDVQQNSQNASAPVSIQQGATDVQVKTAVQQNSQNTSAPATSQQGATDVQVKAAIQQEVPKAPVSAPIQQEAVKASVSATIQQEAVKAPVSATIQQEAVKAPVSVDIQQEAAKAPLSAAIQQEAPKAPASAAIQQEAPKAPASATIQQEAVKAPVTASIKQGASKAPVSAAIQQEAVKAPVSATIQQEAVKAPVSVDIQQEAAKAPLSAAIQQETPKAPASAAIQQEAPKAPVTASIKQGASKSSVTSTSQLSDVVIPAANSAILEYVVSHNSNAGKKGTKINVDMSKIDTSLTPAGNYAAATSAWNAAGRPSSGETYSGLQSSYAYSKLAGGSNKDAVSQLHQQDGNINYKTSMFRSNATTEQGMSNATFSEMVSKNAPVEQQSGIKVQENVEQQNGIKPKNDVKVDMSTDAAELYRSSFEKWRASNMPNEGAVYDEYIAARDLYYETMDIKDTEMANRYHPDRIGTENGMVYDENGMVERSAAKSSDIVEGDTVWDREVSSLLGKGEKGKGRNNVQAAKQESNAKTVENLKQDIKTENTLEQKDTSKQIESVEQQKDIKPTTDTKATENLDQNIKVEETLEQKETGKQTESTEQQDDLGKVVIPAADPTILEYVIPYNSNAGKKGTKINVDMSLIDRTLTPDGNYSVALSAWNAAGRPSSGEIYSRLQSAYAYSKLAGGSNKAAISQLHQQDGNINYRTSIFRSNATTEQGMSNATFSELVEKSNSQVSSEVVKNNLSTTEMVDSLLEAKTIDNTLRDYISKLDQKSKEIIISSKSDDVSRAVIDSMVVDGKIGLNTITENALQNIGTEYVLEINRPLTSDEIMLLSYSQIKVDNGSGIPTDSYSYASTQMMLSLNDMETVDETVKQYISRMDYNSKEALISKKSDDVSRAVLDSMIVENKLVLNHDFNQNTVDNLPDGCKLIINKPLSAYELTILSDVKNVSDRGIEIKVGTKFENARVAALEEMTKRLMDTKEVDNIAKLYISHLDQKSKETIISSKSDDVSRAVIDSMVVDGKIGLNTITENALQNIGTEYVLEINRPLTSDEIMLLSYSQIKVDNGSGIPTDSYSYASTQMMLSLNDMETVDETVKQYISRMDYNSKEALISKKSDDVSRAVLDSMIVENKLVLNHDFNQNTVDNLPDGCKLIINKPLSAYELTILSDVKNVSDRGIEIKVGTKFENARVAALEEMTKRLMDTKEVDNIAKLYISHLDQKSKETIISSKSDAVSKEVLKSMQSDGRITLDTITEIALENIKSTGYVLDVNRPLTSDEIMLLSESDVKVREYTDTIPAKTYAIGEITSSLLNTSVVDETVEQYISKLDQESKELIIGLKSDDVSRAVLDSMVVDGKVTLNVIAKYTLENIKKADYVLEVNRPLTSSELELIRQNGIKIEDNKQNGNINSYSFDEMTSSLLNTSVVDETVKQYISKLDQKSKELIVASKVDDVSKEVLKSMSVNGKISLNTITENTLDNIGTEYVLDVSRPLTSNEILLLSKSDIKVDFNSNPNADPISAREYAIDEMVGSLLGTSVVDETVKQYISAMDNLSKERIIANKSDDVSKAVLESMQVDSKIKLESSLTAYKLINIKDAGYVLEINRPLSSDEVLMLSLDDWSDIKVDFNSNPNADPILAGEYAIDEMKSRLLNTSVVDETVKRYISRFDQKSKEIIIASKCDDVSKTVLDSMVVDGKISLYTITETALQNIESTDYVLDINKTLTSNEILLLNKSDINVLYYDNTLRSAKWVANSEMVMELLETGIVNENVKKYISAMDSLSKETIIANKVDDVSRAVIDSMVVDGKVTLDTITETALQNIKSAGYVLEANGNYSIRDLELISQNGVSVGEKTVSGSEYAFKEMVKASIRNDSIISNYIEKNQDIVRTDDGIFNFVSYTVSTNPSSYSLTAIDIVVDVAIEKFGSVREGFFSSVADSSKTIGYGVDQGILHNLMKYKYRGNEYTYHSVRKLVDDYFAQGKIIPHFNESHSNEYIAVKDFISNKYNFSSDDASVALIAIDNIGGACNYASFANEIMASFIGKEADFYKAFGFPMYVTTDGIKRLNASQLMADIFITINSSEYGGKLFNVDTNGVYTVNRSLLLNEIDPEGRKKLNSGKQQYLQDDLRQSLCSRYLNLKGIKYETKCLTYNNGLGSFEELAKFKLDIANGMRDGKHYSLGVYGSKYFKIKMINKTLEDSRDFDGSGGHSVYITGMTKDGFTVSSWGRQYLVEYNDLINGAFDIDCASFSQKVLSTTEIVENLLEAKTVDDTLRDYISNLDQKSKEIIIASKCDDVSKAVLDSMVVDGKISLSTITDNTLKNIGTEYVLEINRPLTSNEIISLSKYEIKVDTGDGNISSSNIYANTQILSKLQDAKIVDDTVKQYIRNMNYHLKETLISSKVDDVSRAVINSMILNNELLINTSFNQNTL